MDPDQIELKNLSKSFAYQQIASDIDIVMTVKCLKILQSLCKIYYKQQETMSVIGLADAI